MYSWCRGRRGGVRGVSSRGVRGKRVRLTSFRSHPLSLASGRIFNHFGLFPAPKGERAVTSRQLIRSGLYTPVCVRFQGPLSESSDGAGPVQFSCHSCSSVLVLMRPECSVRCPGRPVNSTRRSVSYRQPVTLFLSSCDGFC